MKKARGTRGAIDDAIQGIRWGHDFNGFPTPTNNKFVARVAEGCKRLCTPVKKQRDFLTQEDILELTNSVDRDDIAQLRFIVIVLLGFAGFLRISDILNLKVRNLEFDDCIVVQHTPSTTTISCVLLKDSKYNSDFICSLGMTKDS